MKRTCTLFDADVFALSRATWPCFDGVRVIFRVSPGISAAKVLMPLPNFRGTDAPAVANSCTVWPRIQRFGVAFESRKASQSRTGALSGVSPKVEEICA